MTKSLWRLLLWQMWRIQASPRSRAILKKWTEAP